MVEKSLEELLELALPDLRELVFHTDGTITAKTGSRANKPNKLYGSRTAKHIGGLPPIVKIKDVLNKIINDR